MPAYSVTVSRHVDGRLVASSMQCTADGVSKIAARRLLTKLQDDLAANNPDANTFEFSHEIKALP